MLTYKELLDILNEMPEDDLNKTVTVYKMKSDEYFGVVHVGITTSQCDVLDENHLLLAIED